MKCVSVTRHEITKDRFYQICRDISWSHGLDLDGLGLWKKFLGGKKGKNHVYVKTCCYEVLLSYNKNRGCNFGTAHFYFCER